MLKYTAFYVILFLRYIFDYCGLIYEGHFTGGEDLDKEFADKQLENAYRQYGQAIEKFCRVSLGEAYDSAADCVQEAFYVYYQRLLNGESFSNPRAFIYKTANILVLKEKEKYYKNARRTKPLDDAVNLSVEMESLISDYTDYDKIKEQLIAALSDSEQELYEMKFVKRLAMKEIAEVLSIKPAAAANRVSRLRKRIIKLIREGGLLNEHYR